jgi:hypothetical protein
LNGTKFRSAPQIAASITCGFVVPHQFEVTFVTFSIGQLNPPGHASAQPAWHGGVPANWHWFEQV